jgi:hypothetical protein
MKQLMTGLAGLAISLSVPAVAAAETPTWLNPLADRLSNTEAADLLDRNMNVYFAGLIQVSELFGNTCNPILSIKSDQIPLFGAIGAVGHITACDQPKPIIFLRLQIASPEFSLLRRALLSRLPKPCFDDAGASGVPAKTLWADASRLVGLTSGETTAQGFTVFLERRNTGPSADPEAEASLRRDIEADVPPPCR